MPGAIAFIDARLPDLHVFLDALDPAIQPYVLHPNEDCIPQIDAVLRSHGTVPTLYLVGHGEPGVLYLGKEALDEAYLNRYASTVARWSVGAIALYGCNVGQRPSFLQQWHQLTGAGIAAATKPLGNGYWTLDVGLGTVQLPKAVVGAYSHTLADPLPKVSLALGFGGGALDLSTLDGTNGFRLDGEAGNVSGASVSSAGDVNGDGVDDLIIGAYGASPDGTFGAGSTYVVFGSADGFSATLNLSALNGTNGFRLDGTEAEDRSGFSVSNAGDINGDGIADLIIGAYRASPNGQVEAGSSYVVFGSADGFNANLNLSTLNGTNGFRLDGAEEDERSGYAVSSAGDINGDGIDDLVIGAYRASPNGTFSAGSAYVVFGSANDFNATFDLSTLDGTNGFRLDGAAALDRLGIAVSSAGDVNGDGIADLIVGASTADPGGKSSAGSSYVIFGSDAGFNATLDVSDLDGTNGFRLDGVAANDGAGISVSSAGDINGDGIADLIVGASTADPGGRSNAGTSYVVFGSSASFNATLDLSSLDGTNGFRINGVSAGDNSSLSVSNVGDVNGDGITDLLIGAFGVDAGGNSNAGASYIVFGSEGGFGATVNLAKLDGINGFRLDGIATGDNTGRSVSRAGDVNGDGIADFIIGAAFADPNGNSNAGSSYVVFGSATTLVTTQSLAEGEGTNLTLYRKDNNTGDVTITIAVGGTTRRNDYSLAVGDQTIELDDNNQFTVTIPAGENRVDVTVTTADDSIDEADETLTFTLVENAAAYELGESLGTLTITDSDAQPQLSIGDVTVDEAAGTATIKVTLDAASGQEVTVDVATADDEAIAGSDYTAKSEKLTFAPGETEKNFTVNITSDLLDENNETFAVKLSNAKNAGLQDATALVTITDDDLAPNLSIGDVTVNEADGTATLTVTLDKVSGRSVTVDIGTVNGQALADQDYVAKSGSLTFAAGDTEKTFTVNLTNDLLDEDDESFTVQLSNARNATVADDTATISLTDNDDPPTISIGDITVDEDSGQAVFAVSLSEASGKEVVVNYATADGEAIAGTDYVAGSGQVVFAPGRTKRQVTVDLVNNNLREENETFKVNLSEPTNATIADGEAIATIEDDEAIPGIRIRNVKIEEGDQGATVAEFRVKLAREYTKTVSVDYATENGYAKASSDYDATKGTVTFAPGETNKFVSVKIRGNETYEKREGFFMELSNAVNAPIVRERGKGVILEDDSLPTIKVADAVVTEGDSRKTKAEFVLTLSGATDVKSVVEYTTAGRTAGERDYIPVTDQVTFRPGQTKKVVNINVLGDTQFEDDETFQFEITRVSQAEVTRGRATATIKNDDRKSNRQQSDALTGTRTAIAPGTDALISPKSNDVFAADRVRPQLDAGSARLSEWTSPIGSNNIFGCDLFASPSLSREDLAIVTVSEFL